MQPAGDHHDKIGQPILRIAELVFGNPADFNAGNGMLNAYPRAGEFAIVALLTRS
jgi:hypothetical protein